MENVKNGPEALTACSDVFVKRVQEEYGLAVHHVKVTPREESCMCVETESGRDKPVPVLDVYFRDETFRKVVDERRQLISETAGNLRKLWQEITIPYGTYINRKDYCDSKMYIHAFNFEERCFYDYITNRQDEIKALLYTRLGVRPEKLYPSLEGINIVFSAADYIALKLETKEESLKKEISALAGRYITEKYKEKITIVSYIRFWHPEMPGYNGYWLWLG